MATQLWRTVVLLPVAGYPLIKLDVPYSVVPPVNTSVPPNLHELQNEVNHNTAVRARVNEAIKAYNRAHPGAKLTAQHRLEIARQAGQWYLPARNINSWRYFLDVPSNGAYLLRKRQAAASLAPAGVQGQAPPAVNPATSTGQAPHTSIGSAVNPSGATGFNITSASQRVGDSYAAT